MPMLCMLLAGAALILAVFLLPMTRPMGSIRYPDGRCYLCRRGVAMPGETCSKCGTEQP